LAVLERDRARDIRAALFEHVGDLAEKIAARAGGEFAPAGKRRMRIRDRLRDSGARKCAHGVERLAVRRVGDGELGLGGTPLPVEKKGTRFHLPWPVAFAQSFRKMSRPMSVSG